MKTKLSSINVRNWATRAVLAGQGGQLSRELVKAFAVSRMTATRALQDLVKDGWLVSSGGTRPLYRLGRNRQIIKAYDLPGVDENISWVHDFAPFFDLPKNISGIAHHGFTEMLNNANDHSEGNKVGVLMAVRDGRLTIAVIDDGIGIFEKISRALSLPDRRLAILELSKGKFSTDTKNHSGQGIFFTSRMFDQFEIEANDLRYDHDVRGNDDWLIEIDLPETGTSIFMAIQLDSQRTTREVFDEYASADGDLGFEKTVVPVRLAKIGSEDLVSRSQAKRLVARFDGFRTVLLDFAQVDDVGQAFADEIFRVFAQAHPDIDLIPVNATTNVQQMINRAITSPLTMGLMRLSKDEA